MLRSTVQRLASVMYSMDETGLELQSKISEDCSSPQNYAHTRRNFPIRLSEVLTNPLPLPPRPTTRTLHLNPRTPLLLRIEHQTQHIKTELRELQTHPLELLLCLMPKHMRPRSPERSHRPPDTLIIRRCLLVHEPSIRDLALGSRLREVDLLMC